jgi:hypothetical protein
MGWIKEVLGECLRECFVLLRLLSGAVGILAFFLPLIFSVKAAEKRWEGCLLFIGSIVVCIISVLLGASFIFFSLEAPDEEVMILLVPILVWLDLNLLAFACKMFKGRAKIVMETLQLVFFILFPASILWTLTKVIEWSFNNALKYLIMP